MKPLMFINKLSKDEINEFFNLIGYELNENLFDERTGEKIESFQDIGEKFMCRCSLLPEEQIKKIALYSALSKKLSKLHGNLLTLSAMCFDSTELFFIDDYNCYPALSYDTDEEKVNFYTSALQAFLLNKFGNKYKLALNYQVYYENSNKDNVNNYYNSYKDKLLSVVEETENEK